MSAHEIKFVGLFGQNACKKYDGNEKDKKDKDTRQKGREGRFNPFSEHAE
jgi:hypothetical protein